MLPFFPLKVGDKQPSILATLKPFAVTFVGATVRFRMRDDNTGVVKVDAAAVIVSFSDTDHQAVVRYDWQTADTNAVGNYLAEFVVTYADGTQETFPNKGYFLVEISARV